MNADEKAVAECYGPIVKCSLGKSGDNRLICSCSGCHSHWMAMTLAARIRADAKREMERLRKAMISTSISVRAAFGINADPELKPWNRQHLCDFLDAIADTIDAALKGDA